MNNFNLPSGAKPIEKGGAFAHQAVTAANPINMPFVAPWTSTPSNVLSQPAQSTAPQPLAAAVSNPVGTVTSVATAPQLSTAPTMPSTVATVDNAAQPLAPVMQQPETVRAVRSGVAQLPQTHKELWELSEHLCKSAICPAVLRTPADVFILLAKADSIGMAWPDAFTNLYAIPNGQTGEVKICMYVKTKAGLCRKHGNWDVEVDLSTGTARAHGVRFSDGQKIERTYSGFDASLRGMLTKDANGNIIGSGRWKSNWPDMLKTRALGRFLDDLFPDIVGGFNTYEDLTDLQYEAELTKAQQSDQELSAAAKADEILTKTRLQPKARRQNKKATEPNESEALAPSAQPVEAPKQTSLDTLITEQNPLL